MKNLQLISKDIKHRKTPQKFNVIETSDLDIINDCIDLFNSQIDWDNQFTVDIARNRIVNGEKFFVGYYDNNIFGYCWLKNIGSNVIRVYNVFSLKTNFKRNYGATDMLYDVITKNVNGGIIAEVDDWNAKSLNVFYKLGFTIV